MYNKHQTNKHTTPRVPPFIYGEIKNTIQRIFYQNKFYGWNYSKRKHDINNIFALIGLPAIFNVESGSKDKFNCLVNAQFSVKENEIVLTVGSVQPQHAEQCSRVAVKDDIIRLLNEMAPGDSIRIVIQNDMRRVRRDAPCRVLKIYNLKRKEDHIALISDYDFTRATAPIDPASARVIGYQLAENYKHELHEFVRKHHPNKAVQVSKLVDETLANWARVY